MFILNVDASRNFKMCCFNELVVLLRVLGSVVKGVGQGEFVITVDNSTDALHCVLGSGLMVKFPVNRELN